MRSHHHPPPSHRGLLVQGSREERANPTTTGQAHVVGPTFSEECGLLDREAVCRLLGGSRPINPSTLYRGIRAG
jgi:hypothetical protein